jgi:hypothetical protein
MLGFNDGRLDLPKTFPADVNKITNDQSLEQLSESFPIQWTPETVNAGLDQSFGVVNNLKFNLRGIQIGNITALNYSNRKQHFNVMRKEFNANVNGVEDPIYGYDDETYSQNVRLGALFNWAFRINDNHIIEVKNLFNQINNSQYVNRTGPNYESNFVGDFGSFQDFYRGLYSGQLLGKHNLNNSKTQIDWVLNYGSSYRDMPNYRRYRSDLDAASGTKTLYIPTNSANPFFLGTFFSNMDETSISGALNISQTFEITPNFLPVLSAGLLIENKERFFKARNIGFAAGTSASTIDLAQLTIEELFTPENIHPQTGIRLAESTNPSDSYNAANDLRAYYASATLPISKKFSLVAGARLEDNIQTMNSRMFTGEALNNTQHVTKVLPSVNFNYNLSDKMSLKMAYGKTLNRPEFRERAPFGFFDFDFNWVINGNDALATSFIDNADIRWEWYPSNGEMVTAGVFYKKFTDPIESSYVVGSSGTGGIKNFTFVNAESAYSAGIEIDVRKSLSDMFTSPVLKNFIVIFNTAIIKSKVTYGNRGTGQDEESRPLMGQAPYIVNAGLEYNDVDRGWQITALYNFVGPRIFASGAVDYPSIWEMPRNVIDLTISRNFGENLQIKAGIADILNQPFYLIQDGNRDDKLEKNGDQVIATWKPGSLISMGLTYKLPYGNNN